MPPHSLQDGTPVDMPLDLSALKYAVETIHVLEDRLLMSRRALREALRQIPLTPELEAWAMTATPDNVGESEYRLARLLLKHARRNHAAE